MMVSVCRVIRRTLLFALAVLLVSAPRVYAQTETIEYYATDAVGSVRIVFNATGTVLGRQDYDPFGREILSAWGVSPERFAGQTADGELQQAYFHARQLSSRIGRFGTADPVFGDLSDPQRVNRYSYALNSPLGIADISGLDPIHVTSEPGCNSYPDICLWQGFWDGFGYSFDAPSFDDMLAAYWARQAARETRPSLSHGGQATGQGTSGTGTDNSGATSPPTDGQPPKNDPGGPNNNASCFAKGVAHGAIGGVVLAGVTMVAATAAAPEVVSAGLMIAGAAGGVVLAKSAYSHFRSGNQAGLSYDLGSLVGGAAAGGATSYGARYAITGETSGPSGWLDFSGFKKVTNPFQEGNTFWGNIRASFSKGPDLLGGGAAIAGGAGYSRLGC